MSSIPSTCPRCGVAFVCGVDTGACWCAVADIDEITRGALAQFYDGCLCRECLQSLEDERPQVPTVRAFLVSQLRRKSRWLS